MQPLDDSERALGWAAAVGARTVLCRPEPPANPYHLHVRTLAELPRLLESWTHIQGAPSRLTEHDPSS